MRANKKIIAIVAITLVLAIAAVTGVVMYLNDDGTAQAGFDGNEPSVSVGENTNTITEENNNPEEPNQNPTEPGEVIPGDLPEAGENEQNQGGQTETTEPGTEGTGTATNEEDVPNEEYVTERVEIVEKQISEDLLVGWTPLSINSVYTTSGLGIYKPELTTLKVSSTEDENNSVSAGDILTYVLAVMNTGNEDVTGINISDVIPEQTTLIPETIYGEGTYNSNLNKISWKVDVKAGEVVAVGFAVIVNDNAKGTIKNAGTINGEETQEVLNPVIESSKTAELYRNSELIEGPANVGDQIKYTITVSNTGDAEATAFVQDTVPTNTKLVSDIVLAGEIIDEQTMVNGKDVVVPAGETVTLTFTVEIEKIDGTIANTATVGGTTPSEETETANLEIAKTVSATGEEGTYVENATLKVDQTAYFKIELKNTGSEDLEVTLSDIMGETALDLYAGEEKVTDTIILPAGETKTLAATYKMQQQDIDKQEIITNTIKATTPLTPEQTDTATVTPEKAEPGITVEKTATSVNGKEITADTKVEAGDKIVYTIVVTNTGNVTLHNIAVTDSLKVKYNGSVVEAGTAIDTIESLAPNGNKTYTVEYEVTQADVDNKANIVNTATATDGTTKGEDTTEPIVTDKTPGITVEKTATSVNGKEITAETKVEAGDKIVYTIVVTNTGKVTLHNIAVTDSLKVKYNGSVVEAGTTIDTIESLAPNGNKTYTVEYEVTQADVDNKANIVNTATATDGTTKGEDTYDKVTVNPDIVLYGNKNWVDYNNQEKTRKENIVVKVMNGTTQVTDKEGNPVQATIGKKLDGTYDWTYTFTNLPKYGEDGNVINYTVVEEAVLGYTANYLDRTVDTNGNITANITNTLTTVPTVSLSGEKFWDDKENQDGLRPDNITIALISSDKTDLEERMVTIGKKADGTYDWTYTFTGLPKYDANNNLISYSVSETGIDTDNYVSTPSVVTKDINGNFVANITNVHVPEKITISGTKTWVDDNSAQRPESITVKLMNGKTQVKSVEVKPDANGDWKYTFKDLPKFANGKEIKYSVEEINVEGYTSEVKGYDIVNTLEKPELTRVKTSTASEKVNVGDTITYTITTKNIGDTVAKSVVITDTVPTYTTLKSGTISDNGTVSGTTITWNVGALAVGETKSVSFTVTVNSTADVVGKTIENVGYVNGDPTNSVETTAKKDFKVSQKEYPVKSIDVVLVLDMSTSMNDYSRLKNAKDAACDFIDEMFPAGTTGTGSTVTVITFNDDARKLGSATDARTASELKKDINNLRFTDKEIKDGRGTHIEKALEKTNEVLNTLKNTNKFVVFLSDGAPSSPFSIWPNYKHREEYTSNDAYRTNTEANITSQANAIKSKTTGVYTIGFGIDKLSSEREYWSNYTVCTEGIRCNKSHITVDRVRYHWESAKSYATRILRDIIADDATAEKQYYYTANDSASSIVEQFMSVLQSISVTTRTISAESAIVKIPVTNGNTVNTSKDIVITINGRKYEYAIRDLPKLGVTYVNTGREEYFTWDISNYLTSEISLEYTVE